MDRTMMAPWKAEEKELSEKLYKKLQALALIYPINEELRKLLSWDMFLKPNQAAFFQVMHYIFRLLDPVEFRKRFFWPITDKRSESNFRSSTVEYLKFLNEKHHLNWNNIKSYLVVMPGGMKFITFLLDLVSFVIKEVTKQREKLLCAELDTQNLKDLDIKRMGQHNKLLKELASAYISDIQCQKEELGQKINVLKGLFNDMAQQTGIDVEQLMDTNFLNNFEAANKVLCDQKFRKPAERIMELEQPLVQVKENIDDFMTKKLQNNNSSVALPNALSAVLQLCPMEQKVKEDYMLNMRGAADNSIKLNNLMMAFNSVSDLVREQLEIHEYDAELNEHVTNELNMMKTDIDLLETHITDFQKELHAKAKKHNENQQQQQLSNINTTPLRIKNNLLRGTAEDNLLMSKYVSTPPIKFELPTRSHTRLPLQDDFNVKPYEQTLNSMIAPPLPRSARKIKNSADKSIDMNTTQNSSKIVDSYQLLRTVHKNTAKAKSTVTQSNASALSTEWKQRQNRFSLELDVPPVQVNVSSPTASTSKRSINSSGETLVQSPFTPFNTNQVTCVDRASLSITEGNESSNSYLYSKKSTAVMKVMDALNKQNLSTSPSGRLDFLVPENAYTKIMLNDETLEEIVCFDKENQPNLANTAAPKFDFDLSCVDGDISLNNVSDGVLNDVSI